MECLLRFSPHQILLLLPQTQCSSNYSGINTLNQRVKTFQGRCSQQCPQWAAFCTKQVIVFVNRIGTYGFCNIKFLWTFCFSYYFLFVSFFQTVQGESVLTLLSTQNPIPGFQAFLSISENRLFQAQIQALISGLGTGFLCWFILFKESQSLQCCCVFQVWILLLPFPLELCSGLGKNDVLLSSTVDPCFAEMDRNLNYERLSFLHKVSTVTALMPPCLKLEQTVQENPPEEIA